MLLKIRRALSKRDYDDVLPTGSRKVSAFFETTSASLQHGYFGFEVVWQKGSTDGAYFWQTRLHVHMFFFSHMSTK